MNNRNYVDIFGGGLLVALGIGAAIVAARNYGVGSFARMGPGMFPVGAGLILAGLGVLQAVLALTRAGSLPQVEPRKAAIVLGSIAAFALLITPFGLMPAVAGVAFISMLAEKSPRLVPMIVLPVILCVAAWLIFSVTLGLSTPLFKLPF